MKSYFSFSATKEDSDTSQPTPLPLRKIYDIVRQSLINIGGLTYPLFQRPALWANPESIDDGVSFTFDRETPYGDVRFDKDMSFCATREPIEEETNSTIIFLEALTWEFVFTMLFFNRIVDALKRKGTFRIGIGFAGFKDAHIDWAGFDEEGTSARLINWRFQPPKDFVSYETPGVKFPLVKSDDLCEPICDIIADVSFAVKGIRRTAYAMSEDSRLLLNRKSIENVVKNAIKATQN